MVLSLFCIKWMNIQKIFTPKGGKLGDFVSYTAWKMKICHLFLQKCAIFFCKNIDNVNFV